jgi:hypothetical protein
VTTEPDHPDPSGTITRDALLRLRSCILGREAEPLDDMLDAVGTELAYIDRSADLVGVVRSWIDSDEFAYRWPANEAFERVRGDRAWAALDPDVRPLVHVHVPKTGGTSLNTVLLGHFDPVEVFVQGPLRDFLSIPLARLLSLRLITGHFGLLPVDLLRHRRPLAFSLVRDPYEFYPSLWRYMRKVGDIDPGLSLLDWLRLPDTIPDNQSHALAFEPTADIGFSATGEGTRLFHGAAPSLERLSTALERLDLVAPSTDVAGLYDEICATAGLEPRAVGAFPRLNTTEPEPLSDDERELVDAKSPTDQWLYAEICRSWADLRSAQTGL